MEKYVVSENTEIILNGKKFLLEKGDAILIEGLYGVKRRERVQEFLIDIDDKSRIKDFVKDSKDKGIEVKHNHNDYRRIYENYLKRKLPSLFSEDSMFDSDETLDMIRTAIRITIRNNFDFIKSEFLK